MLTANLFLAMVLVLVSAIGFYASGMLTATLLALKARRIPRPRAMRWVIIINIALATLCAIGAAQLIKNDTIEYVAAQLMP